MSQGLRGKPGERFGDPRLTGPDVLPVGAAERQLGWRPWGMLGLTVAVSPAVYAHSAASPSTGVALLGVVAATLGSLALGLTLSRSAERFGVPSMVLYRAVFGPRGAPWVACVRWFVGVVVAAEWAGAVGRWSDHFLSTAGLFATIGLPVPSQRTVPLLGLGIAWALLACGWWVARGGVGRVVRCTVGCLAAAAGVGTALVVLAGMASKGFGAWIGRPSNGGEPWREVATLMIAGLLAAMTLPEVAARRQAENTSRALRRAWMWGLPTLTAAALVFVGALLASASMVLRQRFDAQVIADAAAFGGILGGGGGMALEALLWLAVVPFVGLFGSASALLLVAPRRVSRPTALGLTATACALLTPLALAGWHLEGVTLLLVPIAALLLVDEVFIRRGRLWVEELYLYGQTYGAVLGLGLAGCSALLVGWALLAMAWLTHTEQHALWALGAGGAAALSYGVLRPVEIGVSRAVRALWQRWRGRRKRSKAKTSRGPKGFADEFMDEATSATVTEARLTAAKPTRSKKPHKR